MVLKSPIENQCVSAGLNGCESIAEGATLYADGDAREGEHKLRRGLRANADKIAELKKFADGLALVSKVPGAGQYIAMLQPAIQLVQQTAAEAAARQPPPVAPSIQPADADSRLERAAERQASAQSPRHSEIAKSVQAPPPEEPPPPPLAKFWLVTGNTLAIGCRFPGTPKMLCLNDIVDSPKLITDIMISSGCPVDVLVTSRVGLENDWVVYAPAGKGAEVHGATLPLKAKRALTIAIAQKSDDAPLDVRCGVTTVWHSVREGSLDKTPQQQAIEAIPPRAGVMTVPYQDR